MISRTNDERCNLIHSRKGIGFPWCKAPSGWSPSPAGPIKQAAPASASIRWMKKWTSKGPEFYDYNARGQVTAQWRQSVQECSLIIKKKLTFEPPAIPPAPPTATLPHPFPPPTPASASPSPPPTPMQQCRDTIEKCIARPVERAAVRSILFEF